MALKSFLFVFSISLYVSNVLSMALHGPSMTRYDPCGLGLIHFDKTITDRLWMGMVNLALYTNLVEAELNIYFEDPIHLAWANKNCNLTINKDFKSLSLKPKGAIPKRYIFYVLIQEENAIPIVTEVTFNNSTLCSDEVKASQTAESFDVSTKTDNKFRHICGRRSLNHTELLISGAESKDGDWPWHVAISIKKIENLSVSEYYCGGSVISRTAVVTAAHCVVKNGMKTQISRVVVTAGTANYTDANSIGIQRFTARDVIIHPCFVEGHATADLAIIKVDGFKFTEYVQPICIWGPSFDKTQLFGKFGTIVGFGQTENNTYSSVLRSSSTVIQSDKTCQLFEPKLYGELLNEFTFCAGFGPSSGINPRNGDSGGGLTLSVLQPDHKLSWFLRGVVSRCGKPSGALFCDPTYYMVYTDVAPHYTWLFHHAGLNLINNIM